MREGLSMLLAMQACHTSGMGGLQPWKTLDHMLRVESMKRLKVEMPEASMP